MTIRDFISLVKGTVKEVNADSRATNKFIYKKGQVALSLLVQRDSDVLNLMRIQNLFQHLKCVEMEEVPKIDPCCNISSKATIWRTKKTLPEIYEDSMGVIIKGVTSIDNSSEITLSTESSVRRAIEIGSRFNKEKYGFYREGRIYLTNAYYRKIDIEALFKEDISHLSYCNCYEKQPCSRFLDRRIILPQKFEKPLLDIVIEEIAKVYKAIPEDINISKTPNN